MRTTLLLTILLQLTTIKAHAQLLAGEVPNGTSVMDLNIDLMLSTPFSSDSAEIEIDCDDFRDIMAVLERGEPPIDAPNTALLQMTDDDLEICAEGTEFFHRPRYYSFGEPLVCSGDFSWQLDNEVVLGDFGGLVSTGPLSVDSMYVAVQRSGQVGWILLSFQVGGSSVRLQVHQALSLCFTTSVGSLGPPATARLIPTITHGEPLRVEGGDDLLRLELFDHTGRAIATYSAPFRTIPAPDTPGIYSARAVHANGQRSVMRFMRY